MLGRAAAWQDLGLPVPERIRNVAAQTGGVSNADNLAYNKARLETLRSALPHDRRYAAMLARQSLGRYVPEGRVLPLGDNRDNSNDGRHFGPVRVAKVLGKGLIIFWPFTRMGTIR